VLQKCSSDDCHNLEDNDNSVEMAMAGGKPVAAATSAIKIRHRDYFFL
jgi:hypothetical protein